jgi:hypothetical protein
MVSFWPPERRPKSNPYARQGYLLNYMFFKSKIIFDRKNGGT